MNLDNFFMVLFISLFTATTITATWQNGIDIDAAAEAYAEAIVQTMDNDNNNEPAVLAMR